MVREFAQLITFALVGWGIVLLIPHAFRANKSVKLMVLPLTFYATHVWVFYLMVLLTHLYPELPYISFGDWSSVLRLHFGITLLSYGIHFRVK